MNFSFKSKCFENEVYVKAGELVDCFYAFTEFKDTLYSAHRRHSLFEFDNYASNEIYVSDIYLTEWVVKESGLEVRDQKFIGPGNDPRIVATNDDIYVLYRGKLGDPNEYYLYKFSSGDCIPLYITNPWISFGKNWAPVIYKNKLFAVHGFAPFRIVEIDTDTGEVSLYKQQEVLPTMQASHDKYSMLRGGSNAIYDSVSNCIYGLGHITVQPHLHIPFVYSYEIDSENFNCLLNSNFLYKSGFNICDPTSIFYWRGRLAVGATYSVRDWFYEQKFKNILIIDNDIACDPLTITINKEFELNNKKMSYYKFYSANDFKSNVKFLDVPYNARQFIFCNGIVSHGPYELVPQLKYKLSIRYSNDGDSDMLQVNACMPNDPICIMNELLPCTSNQIKIFEYTFDFQNQYNRALEICINAKSDQVTLYDIEIMGYN
jgi:hypothetical protein